MQYQITWIDDDGFTGALKPLVDTLASFADEMDAPDSLSLTLTGDFVDMTQRVGPSTTLTKALFASHVLLLDIGLTTPEPYRVAIEDLREPCEEDLALLNSIYGGAAFFLKNRFALFKSCQVIIFLTQYDSPVSEPLCIQRQINPFCDSSASPAILKFNKSSDLSKIADLIRPRYERFTKGFFLQDSWGMVELAAVHDHPVLIIGESGTGKETIAELIHQRWLQEKVRTPQEPSPNPTMMTLNCAALDSELARGQLFGVVRGAFTGADICSLGKILTACGCVPSGQRSADPQREYEENLLASRSSHVIRDSDGLRLREYPNDRNIPHVFGTLFLDEFADLSPLVQTLLLRYLESKEIEPLGYHGRVRGANLRIIVATSDPRVAAFVGERLYGTWRSSEELSRPLRLDLLFRVKAQVIRAEPTTPLNVTKHLEGIIAHAAPYVKWDKDAKKYVYRRILEIFSNYENSQTTGSDGNTHGQEFVPFGHKRELAMLVRLANLHVITSRERGLRASHESLDWVSEDLLKRIWKVGTFDAGGANAASEGGSQDHRILEEEVRGLRDAVGEIVTDGGGSLSENWAWDQFRGTARELAEKNPASFVKLFLLINTFTDTRDPHKIMVVAKALTRSADVSDINKARKITGGKLKKLRTISAGILPPELRSQITNKKTGRN